MESVSPENVQDKLSLIEGGGEGAARGRGGACDVRGGSLKANIFFLAYFFTE